MITVDRVKELLDYNPETGDFVRRVTRARFKAGDVAGSINGEGYVEIKIDGVSYKAHRLAWLVMTGELPSTQIDHENHVRSDNRWTNLRKATRAQNTQNSLTRCDNASGFKGVRYVKTRNAWRFRITVDGHRRDSGYFTTAEAAHAGYVEAARQHFGQFACDGAQQ